MLNFCTLFDKNYLFKGLTLYNSLLKHCDNFTLWILCMDDTTFEIFNQFKLKNVILIKIEDFEDDELKRIKPTRTIAEYCWTLTPSLPLYVLKNNPQLDTISYLDADLFFYSDPKPIFDEFGNNSIMIIEHRFPQELKHLEINGIYNVQMLTFRNDDEGLNCLNWWREKCNEWCYYRLEDGKLGDQKYLDDWPTRFYNVCVLQHKGAGLAIWNIVRYNIKNINGGIYVDDDPLIFYHFHGFHLLKDGNYELGANGIYVLSNENQKIIYKPYIEEIKSSITQVRNKHPEFDFGFKSKENILKNIHNKIFNKIFRGLF